MNIKENNLVLESVTLVAVSSIKIPETVRALEKSMDKISFFEAILISDKKPKFLPKRIKFKKCKKITNLDEYSRFMVYNLASFIKSAFALIVQYDGYVTNPDKWSNEFLKCDYIGSPWPKNLHFTKEGRNIRVGNGGFSLRSKKLLNALNILKLPFTSNGTGFYNEDGIICNYYRDKLERYRIKFSSVNLASRFSQDVVDNRKLEDTFGFHSKIIAGRLAKGNLIKDTVASFLNRKRISI